MISVEKISLGFRDIGLNYGFPMTFVKLGLGSEMTGDELLDEIVKFPGSSWVCFCGQDTIQLGMGTLVKNLLKLGFNTEIEYNGKDNEPKWVHTADRWLVDYIEDGPFNYFALRPQDMVLIDIRKTSLGELERYFENLKAFTGTKCLFLGSEKDKEHPDFQSLVRKQVRCRIYTSGR